LRDIARHEAARTDTNPSLVSNKQKGQDAAADNMGDAVVVLVLVAVDPLFRGGPALAEWWMGSR